MYEPPMEEKCRYEECRKIVCVDIEKWDPYEVYYCNWQCEMWSMGVGWFVFLKLFLAGAILLGIGIVIGIIAIISSLSVHALLVIIALLLLMR